MEPYTTLASKVIEILVPYVSKGAKGFAEGLGKDAYDKSKNLLRNLRKRWSGDKEATDVLGNFEGNPKRYQSVLEEILNEKLEQDKDLANDLDRFLKDTGPLVISIQKMKDAENVVGIDAEEMTEGKAISKQDIEKSKNVTGVKVKRIGR
ncbi:MAG: hypothetical protein PWQ50_1879 [Methanolobus sp.]|jgi:hypothetical protein|nr:hypothetical protein [Methanolobus sp.]